LPRPSTTFLRFTQPHIERITSLFPGGKVAASWSRYPPLSSVEVKETIDIYLHSRLGLHGTL